MWGFKIIVTIYYYNFNLLEDMKQWIKLEWPKLVAKVIFQKYKINGSIVLPTVNALELLILSLQKLCLILIAG